MVVCPAFRFLSCGFEFGRAPIVFSPSYFVKLVVVENIGITENLFVCRYRIDSAVAVNYNG